MSSDEKTQTTGKILKDLSNPNITLNVITPQELVERGIPRDEAYGFTDPINHWRTTLSPPQVWMKVIDVLLKPRHPFSAHLYLFQKIYENWDNGQPAWAWIPSQRVIESTHIHQQMKQKGMVAYRDFYQWSVNKREEFWEEVTEQLGIVFKREPQSVVDLSDGVEWARWYPQAELNIADSCFQADSKALAIRFENEEGQSGTWTYGQLNTMSNRVANALQALGCKKGDAIAIDMLMTAEAVATYLGIVKAGCVAVSIADSFAAEEIKTRLRIANCKIVFTQDLIGRGGKQLPMYQKVRDSGAEKIIVMSGQFDAEAELQVPLRDGDMSWSQFLASAQADDFESLSCQAMDSMNILFSSGTTGDPKAIPWNHSTPVKCAMDAYYHHDVHEGQVLAWPTNLGWMMGPWLIFASLINKASMALFYGAPTGKAFGQFVAKSKVTMLGVVPSVVKAWRASSCMEGLDWSSIRCFSSTGEVSNAEDYLYLMSLASYRPVIEYCGGTEIGGGYVSSTLVQHNAPSTFSSPCLGLRMFLLDEAGKPGNSGELYLEGPSMGLSASLLNRDHIETYYKDVPKGPEGQVLRRHGDQMERLANGYFRAQGRADDTMNLGGIKTSSAEIERVLNQVSGVRETAAIALPPPGGGPSLLVICAVMNSGREIAELKAEMQKCIREKLNPLFKIHEVRIIEALPRTASNKVMRRVLRSQFQIREEDRE